MISFPIKANLLFVLILFIINGRASCNMMIVDVFMQNMNNYEKYIYTPSWYIRTPIKSWPFFFFEHVRCVCVFIMFYVYYFASFSFLFFDNSIFFDGGEKKGQALHQHTFWRSCQALIRLYTDIFLMKSICTCMLIFIKFHFQKYSKQIHWIKHSIP